MKQRGGRGGGVQGGVKNIQDTKPSLHGPLQSLGEITDISVAVTGAQQINRGPKELRKKRKRKEGGGG